MVIFYFRNFLILPLFFLTLHCSHAQTTPVKLNKVKADKSNLIPAENKKVTLRLDSQKRAYYIDPQGDKVIVLDYKTRNSLQSASSLNKNMTNQNLKKAYKEAAPDYLEQSSPEFDIYTSKEGDTWESISQKLYDTDTHWPQLKLWNEELLKDLNILEGSKIKYLNLPKK